MPYTVFSKIWKYYFLNFQNVSTYFRDQSSTRTTDRKDQLKEEKTSDPFKGSFENLRLEISSSKATRKTKKWRPLKRKQPSQKNLKMEQKLSQVNCDAWLYFSFNLIKKLTNSIIQYLIWLKQVLLLAESDLNKWKGREGRRE